MNGVEYHAFSEISRVVERYNSCLETAPEIGQQIDLDELSSVKNPATLIDGLLIQMQKVIVCCRKYGYDAQADEINNQVIQLHDVKTDMQN
jgi:hypothetical protein